MAPQPSNQAPKVIFVGLIFLIAVTGRGKTASMRLKHGSPRLSVRAPRNWSTPFLFQSRGVPNVLDFLTTIVTRCSSRTRPSSKIRLPYVRNSTLWRRRKRWRAQLPPRRAVQGCNDACYGQGNTETGSSQVALQESGEQSRRGFHEFSFSSSHD